MDSILNLTPEQLELVVKEHGQPKYRAGQIHKLLMNGCRSFDEMTNLPKSFREQLSKEYDIYKPQILSKNVSEIDGTIKYLWQLRDGNAVETVLMKYEYGNSVCISTQVGCRQGCVFCASTIGGLVRNLEPFEMYDEVLFTQLDSGCKINNIVLMGIGEPLDNYENVIAFLNKVNHPDGLNIGMRHITLSTCGLYEKIDALADLDLQITLSLSLHSPFNESRTKIMPSNRNTGLDNIISSCKRYYDKTGRRISLEYAMIDSVNDSEEYAIKLSEIAKKLSAHVNLIPLNYVKERELKPSTPENMKKFTKILDSNKVNYTIRRKLGEDVDASCGQLRRKFLK